VRAAEVHGPVASCDGAALAPETANPALTKTALKMTDRIQVMESVNHTFILVILASMAQCERSNLVACQRAAATTYRSARCWCWW
jgi:hypothetical protein